MNDAAAETVDEVEEVEPVEAEAETEEATETEETAESEEQASDGSEEPEGEPSESSTEKKDAVQARMDELTRRYHEERRAREELEERLQTPEKVQPGKTLKDFDYDEAAFAEYITTEAEQRAVERAEQKARQAEAYQRRMEFETKEMDFASKADDYFQVTRDPTFTISSEMVRALETTDKGPEVAYYLAKNRDVFQKLSRMDPYAAAVEIGRIEATQLNPPKSVAPKEPAAPPPKIKASGSGATPIRSDSPESDKLSDDEWLRRERKRLAAKGKM